MVASSACSNIFVLPLCAVPLCSKKWNKWKLQSHFSTNCPVAAKQDGASVTDTLFHGADSFEPLQQCIYHSNQKFTWGWHYRQLVVCLLPSSQTLICLSKSEGITKINFVIFPLNLGCMFSLSTGVLPNKSAGCQLCSSAKQMQFVSAILVPETAHTSIHSVGVWGKLILEHSQLAS